MADDEQAQLPPRRLLQQKVPDLGLGNQVQHGGDLVAQEKPGRRPQSPGDAEPLELSAGELRGIALQPARLDVQSVQHPLLHRPALGQGVSQLHQRVHYRLRVLPYHLHRAVAPPMRQGPAVQQHLSPVRLFIAGEQLAQGGLAPAAGGGQPQPLPRLQGQIHPVQHRPVLPAVAKGQGLSLQAHASAPLSGWRQRTKPPSTGR